MSDGMKKVTGCMGVILLCIFLFFVGIGVVLCTITLLSVSLLH